MSSNAAEPTPPTASTESPLKLRARDQLVLAVIALAALSLLIGYYIWRSVYGPGWIAIDHAPQLDSQIVVNVNTAKAAELMLLPEIGKKNSLVIIQEREDHGNYRSPADFQQRVKGIGPKIMEKLGPHLTGWSEAPAK